MGVQQNAQKCLNKPFFRGWKGIQGVNSGKSLINQQA